MLKKMIKCIFIYTTLCILFIGCDNDVVGPTNECTTCSLELEAPYLTLDENDYYHLDYNDGALQTFTRLDAYVGYELEYLGWTTDITFEGCTWNYCEEISVVNGASYTGEDGYGHTMMGVYEGNIGDTATVWVGYYDNYGKQWLDNIKVIIDE